MCVECKGLYTPRGYGIYWHERPGRERNMKVWRCVKCGYELPRESDLLKICPGCGALGEFKRVEVM